MNELYKLPDNLSEDIDAHESDVKRFISGDLAPGIFKARRVPRGIYEQRKDGSYMMRARVSGGILTTKQALKLADIGENYGDLHITTRQDVQIHNVAIEDTPALMRELMQVGLTSKGGGGNTVRNVAACPFAGICPSEVFDVAPYAHASTEYLITQEGSYNLPRKYKIAFSGCSADCALSRINDLGFIAKEKDGQPGFQVYAGGGMGAISRKSDLIEEWVPASKVIKIAEALRRVFDRTGDRHNRNKARLRFVFERLGAEAVKAELKKELDTLDNVPECKIDSVPQTPETETEPVEITQGNIRFFKQRQDGYAAILLRLPLGFISCDDFRLIAKTADSYCKEKTFKTTKSQDLLLPFIREEEINEVAKALSSLSTEVLKPGAIENFVACAGASTCRLGLCLARGAANASAKHLDKANSDLSGIKVNISGCPNSCGHHPASPVGFFGATMREDGRLVPAYRVVLGAKNEERETRLSEPAGILPAKNMPSFLTELANEFQENKKEKEIFSSYYERKGKEHFARILDKYKKIPSYSENPEFYQDWSASSDFSLAGRGAGECGAGVFEVVGDDITAAKKALEAGDIDKAFKRTIRALLITRGVDSSDSDERQKAFEDHFVSTNLVTEEYHSAISKKQKQSVEALLKKIESLFASMDANLNFKTTGPETSVTEEKQSEPSTELYDLSGVHCPMNFVKAKLKMEMLSTDDSLSIILDDGEPVQNVPASFKAEGQEIVETTDLKDGHWRVVIKKKC